MKRHAIILLFALVQGHSFAQNLTFTLEGYVTEKQSKLFVAGATIKLVGSDNTSLEVKTDSAGYYFFSSPSIKQNTSYVVSASGLDVQSNKYPQGFLGNPKAKLTTLGDSVSKIFRQNFVLIKRERHIGYMPLILFDNNSDLLTSSQKGELDIVVKILTESPNITISVNAHSSYEERKPAQVSFKRAQRVTEYLVEKGVNPERLVPESYGETRPFYVYGDSIAPSGKTIPSGTLLSKDWIEKNCPKSNKADHEYAMKFNRRVTFSILRKDYVSKNNGNKTIPRPIDKSKIVYSGDE